MFSRNKMGMDMLDDFNYGNPMFKKDTPSIAIFDLETLESKGRLYDKSSVKS